jgi:hypothetical protein
MNFAAITLSELAPILTIFVGMLGGFYTLVRFMLSQSNKTSEADRDERKELSHAISSMATNMGHVARNMQEVASSNQRIAEESEKRNGHIVELSIENKNQILDRIDGVIINKQTVHNQVVENEHVINKEVGV